jgi:hypothetical protein
VWAAPKKKDGSFDRDRALIFDVERETNGLAPGCVSAWNKDPVFGVIGVQSGPPH